MTALIAPKKLLPGILLPLLLATAVHPESPNSTPSVAAGHAKMPILEPALPAPDLVEAGAKLRIPHVAAADTIWHADWSFDSGGLCDDSGWIHYDNRIKNDGSNYWSVRATYAGTGSIAGQAAVLAKHDLSWTRDGYGNDWDYSIILEYQGASTLSFDYLSDSEPGLDFVTVEIDSAGASEALLDYSVDPAGVPATFRTVIMSVDGVQNASAGPLALSDFGVPTAIHEVYIRFFSDGYYSDEDGLYPTQWNAGLVVDNIAVTGTLTYTENFEGALNAHVTLVNTAPSAPFGEWARLYQHITDNDTCTENTTCAWLFSDHTTPTLALDPSMDFGPGSYVIRNWLDDILVSPWIAVNGEEPPNVLSYRVFDGQALYQTRIVYSWSLRSRVRIDNTDTSTTGDSLDVVTPWQHSLNWVAPSHFRWETTTASISAYVPAEAREVQVRFRVSDWQYIAGGAPPSLNPGPGPFFDRVRIGTAPLDPRIIDYDNRGQAQDQFATNRFGTAPWVAGADACFQGPWYCRQDHISIQVQDDEADITSVVVYAAIVAGPHAGKAPSPHTVGANGFFVVPAGPAGYPYSDNTWAMGLDDDYFRGGDVVRYFWLVQDGEGNVVSHPIGLDAAPASLAAAEAATGGLFEVNYLPTIDWDPRYLGRIAADPHGDLDPTPEELANSHQANSMLYYQIVNTGRRSGQHTSFMQTLDQLGYAGAYDIYDVQGLMNNQLASDASYQEATGYALIVGDAGTSLGSLLVPIGYESMQSMTKVSQYDWFSYWLDHGDTSEAGSATLWLIGSKIAQDLDSSYLEYIFGATCVALNTPFGVSPDVEGQGTFTWGNGVSSDFTGDRFTLNGCVAGSYNTLGATGTGVVTHRFRDASTVGDAAIVMNVPSSSANTVLTSLPWQAIVPAPGYSLQPAHDLAIEILGVAQPCQIVPAALDFGEVPVGAPGADRSFVIRNVGPSTIDGEVSENCDAYSIVSGAGAFSLAYLDSHTVTVRFEPQTLGPHICSIETGTLLGGSVACTGVGSQACQFSPASLDFGEVPVGAPGADRSFVIRNVGPSTLTGEVSESCDAYSIVSGAGAFSLAYLDSHTVMVRFEPQALGPHVCSIETGTLLCDDVACTGEGITSFTLEDPGVPGISGGDAAWGDYDNDGDLDFVVCGFDGTGYSSLLYRSSGGADPTFSDVGAGFVGVSASAVAWGDYDNDGDLDILLAGEGTGVTSITKLYRNGGGPNPTFTEVDAGLANVRNAATAWGDYDNDGDLDLVLAGHDVKAPVTRLYRNSGGTNPTFMDVGAAFQAVGAAATAWGDYDNDGDLDLVVAGVDASLTSLAKVYRNDGGATPTFTDAGAGLAGVRSAAVAWGDYDNDGDLDLALSGLDASLVPITRVYQNSGGGNPTFTEIGAGLTGVMGGAVVWGDYDNDGDLDVVLAGSAFGNIATTSLYRNTAGSFELAGGTAGTGLPDVGGAAIAWGDYDGDADLDLLISGSTASGRLTTIGRNSSLVPNAPPALPGDLLAQCGTGGATLGWSAASDVETPALGLTYNVRVGTSRGGSEILSPMASADTGRRQVVALGNTGHVASKPLVLQEGQTYYWSVQSLDTGFTGSAFAPEAVLAFWNEETPAGNEVAVGLGPVDLTFDGVQAAGTSELSVQSTGPELPAGLRTVPVDPQTYYLITTLATYSGPIEVCIEYDPAQVQGDEADLQLLHFEGSPGAWVEVDATVDEPANRICGTVASLSAFVVVELDPTDVSERLPQRTWLHQNVPNPFNPTTDIEYDLEQGARVRLAIYDVRGRLVRMLVDRALLPAGRHHAVWDGRNAHGARVASGVYLYVLRTPDYSQTRHLVLLK